MDDLACPRQHRDRRSASRRLVCVTMLTKLHSVPKSVFGDSCGQHSLKYDHSATKVHDDDDDDSHSSLVTLSYVDIDSIIVHCYIPSRRQNTCSTSRKEKQNIFVS